ncbi:hypothetical protein ABIB50_003873 [Mucilaginibacter sp. UYCu711]
MDTCFVFNNTSEQILAARYFDIGLMHYLFPGQIVFSDIAILGVGAFAMVVDIDVYATRDISFSRSLSIL